LFILKGMVVKTKLMLKSKEKEWKRLKVYHVLKGRTDINKTANELIQKGLDSEGIPDVQD